MKVYVLTYQGVYKAVYATLNALLKDYPNASQKKGYSYFEEELL